MTATQLTDIYSRSAVVKAFAAALGKKSVGRLHIGGLSASAAALLFAGLSRRKPQTMLFVLGDSDEAAYFYQDLCALQQQACFFPSAFRRAAKYGQHDAANEILRTEALASVPDGASLIVTSPEGLAELVAGKQEVETRRVVLAREQQVAMTSVVEQVVALGFQRVDYVYEPGQVAVRGSIIDVWSYASELPFRIDFFDDEIDTIRTFEVDDQLSRERRDTVTIVPRLSALETVKRPLTALLPDTALIVCRDPDFIVERIGQIYDEGFSRQAKAERLAEATEQEQKAIERELRRETQLLTATAMRGELRRLRLVTYGAQKPKDTGTDTVLEVAITPQPLFHKNYQLLTETLRQYAAEGYRTCLLSESQKQVERLREVVAAQTTKQLNAQTTKQLNDKTTKRPNDQVTLEETGFTLHEGFIDRDLRLVLFTDHQIFDRYHKPTATASRARQGKLALTMKELQEMVPGDYVVHIDFGIGRFAGLVRVPVGASQQEMIRIVYQGGDKVDVSIHSLYKISKYRNADSGEPPRLSTLGNGAWDRLKERTKKKIKDIARDLIRLYARRRHEQGFQFAPDCYLQHELEASFLYEDTPDQLRATQEVKRDMEAARPMDRLVCGDVGFGKTEVAMRAAFKAACDSKQVAVLVPTTVLAFQHYNTFKKRMAGLPVRVDYLSRARTAKQTTQVLTDLAEGRIDILIGTHKIIGKQVKWKDLGLLIIDEEQKFGVATKEKLRQAKASIDTLTMSATPIPRTLQFSLMGARDMSIMRTPPPNRHPIQTEVATFGHEVLKDAIEFEMARDGQTFIVNPRIANLTEIAHLIEKHVPDCRIAIGHGQMSPMELEKIVLGFINHDYDVLLSTTIVENGIDIPNANTIIVCDAHRFGLSDLHQMRGRVGRSNRKAFCYLLAPPLSLLPADARKRLEALETFSDLGSGFSIAMQDLDLRGAGNILGAEQSGFMEDLGYETYQKILRQAVTELRNDEFRDLQEEQVADTERERTAGRDVDDVAFVDDTAVDSDLEMFFPETYVPTSSERMLLYRELDSIETDEALEAYRQRLIDRFGPVPKEGEELMAVVALRRLGKGLGCEKITLKQRLMQLHLVHDQSSPYYKTQAFARIIDYATRNPRRCQFKSVAGAPRIVISNIPTVAAALDVLTHL